MQRAFVVPLVVTLGYASEARSQPASTPDLLERALPSVVLMLAQRADGSTAYGAGLIVRGDGLVLTNLHFIANAKSLSALLYRKDRLSYTPMDGGLTRYLFENAKELVNAVLVRGDPTSDLALVKIDADTSHVKLLELSARTPRAGEPVLALGHPHESVWSFTAGVVSSLHHGAIQHDAAVNHGNSGGPLLTAQAEVIGINTSKVLNGTGGVAYARPIQIVRNLLAEVQEPSALDLSTPDRAVLSCFHAQELASPDVAHCFDWEGRWDLLLAAMDALGKSGKVAAADLRRANKTLAEMGGKAGWIDQKRRSLVGFVRGEKEKKKEPVAVTSPPADAGSGPEPTARSQDEVLQEQYRERNGLKIDLKNQRAILEAIRMGIRVDEVREVRPGLAWVLIAGRNTDGTEYRISECWVKKGERWLQHTPPSPEERALLPEGWAPPLYELEQWARKQVEQLANPTEVQKRVAAPDPFGSTILPFSPPFACTLAQAC